MKAVILAGGLGTRLSEETAVRPKPMIEIGPMPIIWHIMKLYSAHDVHEFVICLGYKGYMLKEYFANYHLHSSDVTVDLTKNEMEVHQTTVEPWRITLIDTGNSNKHWVIWDVPASTLRLPEGLGMGFNVPQVSGAKQKAMGSGNIACRSGQRSR